MAGTLNDTPGSNRLHIGVFGKTNSGKSSFINAFTHQEVSIVADVAGTTTDPVYKPMEISPLGPCVIIDTAGFDDETELGERRVEKTKLAAEKGGYRCDRGIWRGCLQRGCFRDERCKEKLQQSSEKNQENLPDLTEELKWYQFLKEKIRLFCSSSGKQILIRIRTNLLLISKKNRKTGAHSQCQNGGRDRHSRGRTRPPCAGKLRR